MGGTDDPSNLIEISVEEHADAHHKLYEQFGLWQDYAAWQGLSGRMNKEEIIRYKLSQTHKGKKLSPEHIEVLREKGKKLIGKNNPMFGKTISDEQKLAISKANKGKFVSEKTKERIRQYRLGKRHTEESKEKNRLSHLGKISSIETRMKISESNKKRIVSDSHKKKTSEKLSKKWSITNSSGSTFIIKNLRQFCKDNNLDQGNMSRNKVKGWNCIKIDT
jgi:hypothetical protein